MRPIQSIAWLTLLAAAAPAQDLAEIVLMEEEFGAITTRIGIGTLAREINTAWLARRTDEVADLADRLREQHPGDFRAYALEYLSYLELGQDRKRARTVALRAAADLQRRPVQLVEFITRALYSRPTADDYQLALMSLVPLVADHRNDPRIRVAHLRALMGCGKIKEAVITNKGIVQDLDGDTTGLLLLASTICDMENARSLAGVADKAITKVLDRDSSAEEHLRVRYRVLHLLGRGKEADAIGRELVTRAKGSGLSLNNWVWYLMTRREYAGKYTGLALMGAEEMMKEASQPNYALDTIALALYQAGRLEEAVEYQSRAVQAGGDADYRKRLEMYSAALTARKARSIRAARPDR